jgi:hypothetical protein
MQRRRRRRRRRSSSSRGGGSRARLCASTSRPPSGKANLGVVVTCLGFLSNPIAPRLSRSSMRAAHCNTTCHLAQLWVPKGWWCWSRRRRERKRRRELRQQR